MKREMDFGRDRKDGKIAARLEEAGAPSVGAVAAWQVTRSREEPRGSRSRRRVKRGKEGLGCVSLPPSGAHLPSPQQSRTVRSDQEPRRRSRTNDSLLFSSPPSPTIDLLLRFPPPHHLATPRVVGFSTYPPSLSYPYLSIYRHLSPSLVRSLCPLSSLCRFEDYPRESDRNRSSSSDEWCSEGGTGGLGRRTEQKK